MTSEPQPGRTQKKKGEFLKYKIILTSTMSHKRLEFQLCSICIKIDGKLPLYLADQKGGKGNLNLCRHKSQSEVNSGPPSK